MESTLSLLVEGFGMTDRLNAVIPSGERGIFPGLKVKSASDDQAFSKQMYSFLRDCIGLQIEELAIGISVIRSKSTAHCFYHCLARSWRIFSCAIE